MYISAVDGVQIGVVQTYPLESHLAVLVSKSAGCFFAAVHGRRVVESRRCRGGRSLRRQVVYPGEINDSQQAAWRKTIEVLDEQKKHCEQLPLFPSDRPIPPDEVNALSGRGHLLEKRNFPFSGATRSSTRVSRSGNPAVSMGGGFPCVGDPDAVDCQ